MPFKIKSLGFNNLEQLYSYIIDQSFSRNLDLSQACHITDIKHLLDRKTL